MFAGSSPRGRGNTSTAATPSAPRPVHPAAGRGTPGEHLRRQRIHRFIPARAGEHSGSTRSRTALPGSSPRGRGTPLCRHARDEGVRFIPARAGNTSPKTARRAGAPVHPRAGGEHAAADVDVRLNYGSSPRGRGTPDARYARLETVRFIPARAGNTSGGRLPPGAEAVHPRAGGEHALDGLSDGKYDGSSPRGRGTLFSQPSDSANLF